MTWGFSSYEMLRCTDWQIVTGIAKDYRFFLESLTMKIKSLWAFENSIGSYLSMQHNIPEIWNLQATLLWGFQIRTWRFVWTWSNLLFSTLNCLCTYIILLIQQFFWVLSGNMCELLTFHENQDATSSVRTRRKWEIFVIPVLFCFWHDCL
jgi:hypothetical protein